MNRSYECMVLLDNREVRQGWDALKDNVSGMLTKHGAEIVSSKLWEERKLAYPIKQQQRGTYLLVYFNAPTGEIAPINREFKMAEPVLRHTVTVCETIPDSAHEPEADFDVSAIGQDEAPEPEPAAADEPKASDAATADDSSDETGDDKAGDDKAGDEKAGDETAEADAPEKDATASEAPETEKEES